MKKRRIRTKIGGRGYTIKMVNHLDGRHNSKDALTVGRCDHPSAAKRSIHIRRRLSDGLYLDTVIHELIHAAAWDHDEEWVKRTATEIASALSRLGVTVDRTKSEIQ